MELWFIYAVASAIFAGLHSFAIKMAAARGHDASLSTAISAIAAAVLGWFFLALFSGIPTESFWVVFLLSAASGVVYTVVAIMRIESLKRIDTTIFFPLYKTIGPIVAVLAGTLFFNEHLNSYEFLGIILSITVPLLLLHREENKRQKALVSGIILMAIATTLTVGAHVLNKLAVDISTYVLFIATVAQSVGAVSALSIWYAQKYRASNGFTEHNTKDLIIVGLVAGTMQFISFYVLLKAFELGTLSIAYTINSLYIVIPIVLSVWWYKEHFNLRKGLAVALSILALAFLR